LNKKNSYDYKKILILISLMIIFSLSFITPNIYTKENGYFDNPNDDTTKELENNDLRSQGLTSDNVYNGIGAAWNLTHWANRTDNNLDVSFENNLYDIKNMPLDVGWQGYKLNATIKDLYDERNWVNGTFDCGTDDGWDSDDSDLVQNWTFGYNDIDPTYDNDFWGNYFDGAGGDPNIDQTCLGLTLYGGNNYYTDYGYDKYDACWWNTSFTLPRGDVIAGEINLAIYPYTQYHPSSAVHDPDFGSHFSFRVTLNDVCIDDKNLIWLQDAAGGSGNWVSLKLQLTNWLDNKTVFPDGVKDMNLELKLLRVGATYSYNEYGYYQRVLFDNVSLIVKAEAKPEQIDLHINQTNYVNDIDWGEGIVEIDGNWNGTQYPWVHANFSSDEVWDLGGYDVDFKTDLNLFAIKNSPETNYETNTASLGSSFSVNNDSLVNWECYGYTSVPTGYTETDMRLEFPTDLNITWISYPSDPLTNKLDLCDNSTAGLLIVNVSKISATPDGFWKFKALSPNYCEQLNIYNNATGSWIEDNEFLSGHYINITGKITNNSLISGYIQDTKAILHIRFPNGTIWTEKTQEKNLISNGFVYFDSFQIPSNIPNYKVGEYDAIITWNNSHSIYGLNETGIIYKKFTVIHNSTLIPDQSYYADIFEGTSINLKVSFNDLKDGKAIEGAVVYTYNFTHDTIMQNFSEISPGYYVLLDFNVSGGNPGENNLTIYANSSLNTNNQVNVTIELILETTLTAEEYPSVQVPWNTNFTIHLNYTEKISGDGIETTPVIYWNGDTHTKATGGVYNITCNSSAYEVNKRHNLNIDFNKTGYETQLITIIIEILERETYIDDIFINNSDCTSNKSFNVKAGEFLNLTVKYRDIETGGTFINNASVKLIGTGIDKTFNESLSFQHYNLTLNSTELGIGVKFLTISAQKDNYSYYSELLTITVFERGTNYSLYFNRTDYTGDPSYQLTDNQLLNITISYRDSILMEHIIGATVDINGSGISKQFTEAFNNYSIVINSTYLNLGVNFLTIYAQRETYEPQSILLTIEVIQIETQLKLFRNGTDITAEPSIKQYTNQILNITVSYIEVASPYNLVSGAIVDINGSGISKVFNEFGTNYSVLIDMIDLNQGANFLTIYARKDKYEPQAILLTIEIILIETVLKLYLDGVNKTNEPSITLYTNQILNITISYQEAASPYNHVSGAIVDINGSGISKVFNEAFNNYSGLINTANLNLGANFLTIYAHKDNYEPQTILLTIEIILIETEIKLFLNGVDKTNEPSITLYTNQLLNITISYRDSILMEHIIGATVDINGSGISKQFTEAFNNYSVEINSTYLNLGANFLTIYARKDNYEPQTILISIEIIQIETNLTLYINGTDITAAPSIKQYTNQILNITVSYIEYISPYNHVGGAIVDMNGSGISELLYEAFNNYSVLINTADLNLGANFLTIYARKDNYEPLTILLTIEIIQIETEIKLFLNGVDKTNEPSIDVINLETLNITIKYTTYGTGAHIINATIELSGSGLLVNLSESLALNQYWIVINIKDLNPGFNFLTIYAQKNNYEAQTILITIQVIDRETDIEIYLNNIDKTLEKSIEIPIGEELNITFKYIDDLTRNYISQALIQLIGTGYTWNFTEYPSLQHYTLRINTRDLDVGLKFLTIYASKTDYQSSSELLKITVRQIITNITLESGEDVINIQTGESYTLSIILYDLDFEELIKNATVRYTWELGQGYLTDEDNDGIYKVTLENIPPGTFTFTFTVLNVSDDYLFERKTITLNVVSPPEEALLFQILTIVAVAAVIGISSYFIAYQRILKYPKPVRKIHKFKKTLKKKKGPDVEIVPSKVILTNLYKEELDPIAKLFKGKIKPELSEQQPEQKPLKDNFSETLSEKLSDDSEKKEI